MEEIGLRFSFEEHKVRGTSEVGCGVLVTEQGDGHEVTEFICLPSWEEFKAEYPTLESILEDCTRTANWNADWRNGDRELYIESIRGHEGLYEYTGDVRVHC